MSIDSESVVTDSTIDPNACVTNSHISQSTLQYYSFCDRSTIHKSNIGFSSYLIECQVTSSSIGNMCCIQRGANVRFATIHDRASIGFNCDIDHGAVIEKGVFVPDNAMIHKGCRLERSPVVISGPRDALTYTWDGYITIGRTMHLIDYWMQVAKGLFRDNGYSEPETELAMSHVKYLSSLEKMNPSS